MIELIGLPPCEIKWSNIPENADGWTDQDMVWIILPNGISIDAGEHGYHNGYEDHEIVRFLFFRVDVVPKLEDDEDWYSFESSFCRTTQELAQEVVRLANKYSDPWYANLTKLK